MTSNGPQSRSLIDTRKRKQHEDANITRKMPRTATTTARGELYDILKGNPFPQAKYNRLVALVEKQMSTIGERGVEISERNSQIHDMKCSISDLEATVERQRDDVRELRGSLRDREQAAGSDYRKRLADAHRKRDRQDDKLFEQEKKIKDAQRRNADLRERVAELEDSHEEQETALLLSTALATRAHEERDRLRSQLFEVANSTSPDQIVHVALEAQAQQHLQFVHALQADVTSRDAVIGELTRQNADNLRNVEERQETLISNYKRMEHELSEKIKAAEEKAVDEKIKGQNALAERNAEVREVTEAQGQLIKRLMEENSRLAANQRIKM